MKHVMKGHAKSFHGLPERLRKAYNLRARAEASRQRIRNAADREAASGELLKLRQEHEKQASVIPPLTLASASITDADIDRCASLMAETGRRLSDSDIKQQRIQCCEPPPMMTPNLVKALDDLMPKQPTNRQPKWVELVCAHRESFGECAVMIHAGGDDMEDTYFKFNFAVKTPALVSLTRLSLVTPAFPCGAFAPHQLLQQL